MSKLNHASLLLVRICAIQNKDFRSPEDTLPALLVRCHGGPTSAASASLNMKIQYFTSRGIAVLDVDYRGSTGYGKQYRNRLRNKYSLLSSSCSLYLGISYKTYHGDHLTFCVRSWGVCDVEDASSGARYLADEVYIDRNKVCIDGGSAGGYTTLACLAFTDSFKAGTLCDSGTWHRGCV